MNTHQRQAFGQEMSKLAGVGWDIHGYAEHPDAIAARAHAASSDAWDRIEALHDARIKTPHDQHSDYKLNMAVALHDKHEKDFHDQFVTDSVYADTPTNRVLTKVDLPEVMARYTAAAQRYNAGAGGPVREYGLAGTAHFLNKAKHLLEHPDVKFVRLEME